MKSTLAPFALAHLFVPFHVAFDFAPGSIGRVVAHSSTVSGGFFFRCRARVGARGWFSSLLHEPARIQLVFQGGGKIRRFEGVLVRRVPVLVSARLSDAQCSLQGDVAGKGGPFVGFVELLQQVGGGGGGGVFDLNGLPFFFVKFGPV